jgi:hypothetical protein
MPDPLPDWVDEDVPAPPSSGRRAALLALAALPWIVVLALVLAPDSRPGTVASVPQTHVEAHAGGPPADGSATDLDASGTHDAGPGARDVDPGTPDEPGSAPQGPPGWEIAALQGAWRATPGDGATAALATAIARAWLTGVRPVLRIEGLEPPASTTYAEHLVVEAIERPAAGAAVVTVLAVLLDTDDGGAIGDSRLARLAVPVVEDADGPHPGGAPWPLPGPGLSLRAPATVEVTDTAVRDRALEALHLAGYEGAELLTLEVGDGWPWVARFQPPDGTGPSMVWLRRHLERFVVTGLPLGPALGGDGRTPAAADAATDDEEVAP